MDALLSKDFLKSIGVDLDDRTYIALSEHYENELYDRIIDSIVDELDKSQLDELSRLKDGDSLHFQKWLLEHVVRLDEIVETEVTILMGDMAEGADKY